MSETLMAVNLKEEPDLGSFVVKEARLLLPLGYHLVLRFFNNISWLKKFHDLLETKTNKQNKPKPTSQTPPQNTEVNWEKMNALFKVLISDMDGKSAKPDIKQGKTSISKPGLLPLGDCLCPFCSGRLGG